MKLLKAIEIVELGPPVSGGFSHWDYDYALKLLIEAGKRVIVFREYDAFGHRVLLPGETKD
jgi:hypothetical protein